MGHGKSALVNSCKYVLDDEGGFIEHAEAGEIKGGAVTLTRRAYDLTEAITIVDNRGYATMDSFERIEVYTQLGEWKSSSSASLHISVHICIECDGDKVLSGD